jgi:hypothetical protein
LLSFCSFFVFSLLFRWDSMEHKIWVAVEVKVERGHQESWERGAPTRVAVSMDAIVDDLKEKVKLKFAPDLDHIAAPKLVVYGYSEATGAGGAGDDGAEGSLVALEVDAEVPIDTSKAKPLIVRAPAAASAAGTGAFPLVLVRLLFLINAWGVCRGNVLLRPCTFPLIRMFACFHG